MTSGGSGACRSRGRREAMPKPVSLRLAVGAVHQDIGRLDVLVDEPALMDLAQRSRDADGEAQEASHLHRRAEQPVERLAARILQHQHGPAAVADELQRSRRPRSVQRVLQSKFMRQAIEGRRCRMLRGGKHGQHDVPAAIGILAPRAAEDAIAVLPQDLEVALSVCAEPNRCVQLPNSTIGLAALGLRRPLRPFVRSASQTTREQEVCHIQRGMAISGFGLFSHFGRLNRHRRSPRAPAPAAPNADHRDDCFELAAG